MNTSYIVRRLAVGIATVGAVLPFAFTAYGADVTPADLVAQQEVKKISEITGKPATNPEIIKLIQDEFAVFSKYKGVTGTIDWKKIADALDAATRAAAENNTRDEKALLEQIRDGLKDFRDKLLDLEDAVSVTVGGKKVRVDPFDVLLAKIALKLRMLDEQSTVAAEADAAKTWSENKEKLAAIKRLLDGIAADASKDVNTKTRAGVASKQLDAAIAAADKRDATEEKNILQKIKEGLRGASVDADIKKVIALIDEKLATPLLRFAATGGGAKKVAATQSGPTAAALANRARNVFCKDRKRAQGLPSALRADAAALCAAAGKKTSSAQELATLATAFCGKAAAVKTLSPAAKNLCAGVKPATFGVKQSAQQKPRAKPAAKTESAKKSYASFNPCPPNVEVSCAGANIICGEGAAAHVAATCGQFSATSHCEGPDNGGKVKCVED